MKLQIQCDWCGRQFERLPSQLKGKKHHFCSRGCLAAFSNKEKNPAGYDSLKDYTNISRNLSELNRQMNPTRMTSEIRQKIRNSKVGSGEGKTYTKQYGRHEHRIVAERILGRKLLPGEVVHHIDGNKRNNAPENIMVLESQSEHASLHVRDRNLWKDWR